MDNLTISIFGNKIFLEIIKEIKLFSKYVIKHYDNLDFCISDAKKENQVLVFFVNKIANKSIEKLKERKIPHILISKNSFSNNNIFSEFKEQLNTPFTIFEFEKKIIRLMAKTKFRENSLILLNNYVIDKNERKIKKDNLELQLSEKEVDFLILFTKNKEPINRNFVLENVWNYSTKTETHTIETHIHRLRKKIFEKFGDRNFIKNNSRGYFI